MSSQEHIPQTFDSNKKRLQNAQQSLDIPEKIIDTAVMIYKQSYQDDLYHGRSINDILSACLHLSCRIERHPINPSDISKEFDIDRKTLLKTSRHFESNLGLETAPVNPAGFIDSFSQTLSLSDSTTNLAHDIFETFLNSGQSSGKSPTGLAAGAIYAATKQNNERVTQEKLSEVADVSEVTIRNLYKIQLELFNSKTPFSNKNNNKSVVAHD